jgi:hypothetical protein
VVVWCQSSLPLPGKEEDKKPTTASLSYSSNNYNIYYSLDLES